MVRRLDKEIEQRFLRMQAIFSLIPRHGAWVVQQVEADLFATVSRQAVHEQHIVGRQGDHQERTGDGACHHGVDAGTRAGRFMLQDLLGSFVPALKRTESWGANLLATGLCVAMWGYLLYQGVIDPLGGINTLWPLFGISNQMLAGIALMLATVVLIKMKRQRYIWVTMLPAIWLLICTTVAGFIKLFDANPAVGFLALANKYSTALEAGQVIAPAKNIDQMQHVIINAYTNAGLTVLFLFVVFSILFFAIKVGVAAWGSKERTDKESPYQAMPDA